MSTDKTYLPDNDLIAYQGRTEIRDKNTAALIGSASSINVAFKGAYCELLLSGEFDHHNYINLELDGKYLGRMKIEGQVNPVKIQAESLAEIHSLSVYKATEAASGAVLFHEVIAQELVPIAGNPKKTIEFIGNSITCGALSDSSQMPCDQGEYLDHHNAYMAYGPQLAKALNVDFVLSSVSGIGMYRNWNDENIEEPIMPQVYENLYLNTDDTRPYVPDTKPDITSICLGTNDMSGGDGIKARLPFDSNKFAENYINFVKLIYRRYPDTKIVLLNSPMLTEENNVILMTCLRKVQSHFVDKKIELFEFDQNYVDGCSYHPSVTDHKAMASRLTPFFKRLLTD